MATLEDSGESCRRECELEFKEKRNGLPTRDRLKWYSECQVESSALALVARVNGWR